MIHKQEYNSKTLSKFKLDVMHLNLNRKPANLEDEEVQKAEMLKYN
jgi:hypothetical protein